MDKYYIDNDKWQRVCVILKIWFYEE